MTLLKQRPAHGLCPEAERWKPKAETARAPAVSHIGLRPKTALGTQVRPAGVGGSHRSPQ